MTAFRLLTRVAHPIAAFVDTGRARYATERPVARAVPPICRRAALDRRQLAAAVLAGAAQPLLAGDCALRVALICCAVAAPTP
jgi:hypothetical protein